MTRSKTRSTIEDELSDEDEACDEDKDWTSGGSRSDSSSDSDSKDTDKRDEDEQVTKLAAMFDSVTQECKKNDEKLFCTMFALVVASVGEMGGAGDNISSMNNSSGASGSIASQHMLKVFDHLLALIVQLHIPLDATYCDAGSGEGVMIVMLIAFLRINNRIVPNSVFGGFDCNRNFVESSRILLDRLFVGNGVLASSFGEWWNKNLSFARMKIKLERLLIKIPPACGLANADLFRMYKVEEVTVLLVFSSVWDAELKAALIWVFARSPEIKLLCALGLTVHTTTHTDTHKHTNTQSHKHTNTQTHKHFPLPHQLS